jgi:hypothetical protein
VGVFVCLSFEPNQLNLEVSTTTTTTIEHTPADQLGVKQPAGVIQATVVPEDMLRVTQHRLQPISTSACTGRSQ